MSLSKPRAFIASHLYLLEDGKHEPYAEAAQACADAAQFLPMWPIDSTAEIAGLTFKGREQGYAHADASEELLRGSHVLVADLTPQRGVHALPSVAYWIGMARGLGKPCFGFTAAKPANLKRRVMEQLGGSTAYVGDEAARARAGEDVTPSGPSRDGRSGLLIEDFGMSEEAVLEFPFLQNESILSHARDYAQGFQLAFTEARRWVDAQNS